MQLEFIYFSSFYLFLLCNAQIKLNVSEDPYYLDHIEILKENFAKNGEELIHRLCTHRSRFTDEEIETARVYIQNRYLTGASVKPQKPACKTLKVIRDFKCLSHSEKLEFTEAFRQLYKNGVIDRISYYHGGYWPFVHLFAQTFAFHNRFLIDLQQEIEKINPSVIIPYWDTSLEFDAPEKSIVWDYFGHSGNESNDYCVPDGPFSNLTLKYPTPHCLRRQWNSDGTIPKWESPEVQTFILQQSSPSFLIFSLYFMSQHFKKHLNIGGLNGDFSIPYATNDPLFHLYHIYDCYINIFKWQLERDENLVSLEFNEWRRREPQYEFNTGRVVQANVKTDTLLSYNETTIAEAMSFGFGQFCYIPDQIIEHINNVVRNTEPKLSTAVQRLRNAFPNSDEFAQYFPRFASNTSNQLHSLLTDIGSGNNPTNKACKPMPLPPGFNSTANGKRQFENFSQLGQSLKVLASSAEQSITDFINALNKYQYCSPYIV